MPDSSHLSSRKSDHIKINLDRDVRSSIATGLEEYHLIPQALPEIDLDEVDCSLNLLGRCMNSPVLISSMTGGLKEAEKINHNLAEAAQHCRVALGIGSQRAGIEQPELLASFQVRDAAPDILLFGNLGAVQLNYGYTVDECRKAVDMIKADALFLHLNALQEAVQPEGNTRFSNLLKKIEMVCRNLEVPVFIKEVGWGISAKDATRLASIGIAGIDVAGAGGTSWSKVEMHRISDPAQASIASSFDGWGIPTAKSLQQVRQSAPDLMVFASGGLRDGIDIAKCIALGADIGGMASPFLKSAAISADECVRSIMTVRQELRISMFACGIKNLRELRGNISILEKRISL